MTMMMCASHGELCHALVCGAVREPTHTSLSHVPTLCRSGITHHANDYVTVSCGPTNGLDDYLDRVVANESYALFTRLVNLRCDYKFTCADCRCCCGAHLSITVYPCMRL